MYADAIKKLGTDTNLKSILRTLENQTGEIFRGEYNGETESKSITTCLEKLGQLILPDNETYLEMLESFIVNGVCNISRHYEEQRSVSPIVLNFLMTAIRSYNHIRVGTPFRVNLSTCRGLYEIGNAFLTQVLVPHIDAGALHVFPPDSPMVFKLSIEQPKQVFKIRSPSPPHGNRIGSISTAVSFSKALRKARRHRRTERKRNVKPGEHISNSDSGTASDSDGGGRGTGGGGGGRKKTNKRNQSARRHRK